MKTPRTNGSRLYRTTAHCIVCMETWKKKKKKKNYICTSAGGESDTEELVAVQ